MKIDINKDLELDFKHEVYKGLSKTELIGVVCCIIVGIAVGFIIWKTFGIPFTYAVYFGFPFMIGVMLISILKYQGVSYYKLFKDRILYYRKTKKLLYVPGEYEDDKFIFSTRKEKIK